MAACWAARVELIDWPGGDAGAKLRSDGGCVTRAVAKLRPIALRGLSESHASTFAGKPTPDAALVAALSLLCDVLEHGPAGAGPLALGSWLKELQRGPSDHSHLSNTDLGQKVLPALGVRSVAAGVLAVSFGLVAVVRGGAEAVVRMSHEIWQAVAAEASESRKTPKSPRPTPSRHRAWLLAGGGLGSFQERGREQLSPRRKGAGGS